MPHLAPSTEDIDWAPFLARPRLPSPPPGSFAALQNQSILVTGAAGSIGSALAFRLAGLHPRRLVLLDASEQAIYRLTAKLASMGLRETVELVLGNANDKPLLEEVFTAYRPQVIFHAAAYKHLPLLEEHPLAAIANNALATYTLAQCAKRHSSPRIVLVSTDKAAAPTSILGATKRIAELIALANNGIALRLANVLGTDGSVVTTFLHQIASGSPLSVTHLQAKRYFLTCEEAVDLLISAAVETEPTGLFVPRLDHPHSVVALADFLINLASAGQKIDMLVTHPRPGEKITEALWSAPESKLISTSVPNTAGYMQINPLQPSGIQLERSLTALESAVHQRDLPRAIEAVMQLVPDYQPSQTLQTRLCAASQR